MKLVDLFKKIEYKQCSLIGRDKYFNSAVMATICEIDGEEYFVLQKRAKGIRQGGEISFPGGKYDEEDGSFIETAVRETEEEMGISRDDIKVLGKIGTVVIPSGLLVEAYLGVLEIDTPDDFNINSSEVERVLFVPFKFFMENKPRKEKINIEFQPHYEENGVMKEFPAKKLGLPERYFKPWGGRAREVYLYSYDGEIIWGLTADIIIEIVNMVREINVEKSLGIM